MLFQIIDNLFFIYMIMILIRIFGSWVPEFFADQVHALCRSLHRPLSESL